MILYKYTDMLPTQRLHSIISIICYTWSPLTSSLTKRNQAVLVWWWRCPYWPQTFHCYPNFLFSSSTRLQLWQLI